MPRQESAQARGERLHNLYDYVLHLLYTAPDIESLQPLLQDADSRFLLEHGEIVIVIPRDNLPATIPTSTNIYPGETRLLCGETAPGVTKREMVAAKVALAQDYVTDDLVAIKVSFLQYLYYLNKYPLPLEVVLPLAVPSYPCKIAYNPLKTMIQNPAFLKKIIEEASAETLAAVEAAHSYPIVEEVIAHYSSNVPLLKAVMRKYHEEISKMMLQSMFRVPLKVFKLFIKHHGNNPMLAELLLEAAIHCDDIDKIRYLLTVPGIDLNKALYDQTVVASDSSSFFAWDEHRESFDLKEGENISIPLVLAISRQQRDVVELLLEHGAQLPIIWRGGLPTLILTSSCNLDEVYHFICDFLYHYFNIVSAANEVDEEAWGRLSDPESNAESAIEKDVVEVGEAEYFSDGAVTDGDDDEPAPDCTAAAIDKVVVPVRSQKEILSAIVRIQNVLAKQAGIGQDATEALQSLVLESLYHERREALLAEQLPELLEMHPEISLILTETASALHMDVSDQVEIMAILCSDHQKVNALMKMLKKVKTAGQDKAKAGWVLPGDTYVEERDTYVVESSMQNALYFYIEPELAAQYPEHLHIDALAGIRMLPKDSCGVAGIKHLGGIVELKIVAAGDTRFTAKAMYRNKDGALLIVFDQAMTHDEVATHVSGSVTIVSVKNDAVNDSDEVAGPIDSTLPKATIADFDTNAAILGIPVVHGDISGDGIVIIDSDGEQGHTYPEGSRVICQAVQDGAPSCSDNALLNAMKLKALGKLPFLLKVGDHVVVGFHTDENTDAILDQMDSVDLEEYPELWSQYLEVMTGCSFSDSVISDLSTFSWLQDKMSIVKDAVPSWGSNTLTAYINNILDTLSELDFISPELHKYAGEAQAMLASLLANIGTQTSGVLPVPGRGPGFDLDDSVPGGGSGFKADDNLTGMIDGNSTNTTAAGDVM